MKTKGLKVRLIILTVLCAMAVIASTAFLMVSAEEISEPETTKTETLEGDKETRITDIFYDKVLPVVISACSSAGGALVIAIIPIIKLVGKNKKKDGLLKSTTETVEYLKKYSDAMLAKLAELSKDYEELKGAMQEALKESFATGIAKVSADVGEQISGIASKTNEQLNSIDFNIALIGERQAQEIEGHILVWANTDGAEIAVQKMVQAPDSRMTKRNLLKIRKMEESIAQFKGEEAEKIIANIDAEVDEQYRAMDTEAKEPA